MAVVNTHRVYYQGKIVAYMKKNGVALRYKLYRIEKQYVTRLMRVSPKVDGNETINQQIDELESKIDNIITRLLLKDPKTEISVSMIEKTIEEDEKRKNAAKQTKHTNNNLLCDYWDFITTKKKEKELEDIERGIIRKLHPTIKDYISSYNSIKDFEHFTYTKIRLSNITVQWTSQFVEFLTTSHEDSKRYRYTCKGNLCNKTANKRLDCLATFILHHYQDIDKANIIKSKKQDESVRPDILRLYKEELTMLADLALDDNSEMRIRDYFLFICLTGLRFSDFISIDKSNFIYNGRYWCLRLLTQKTVKKAEIPLTNRAYDIALKYGFKFNYYCNQAFNRVLKDFLKSHKLFEEEYVFVKQVRKKLEKKTILRREKISCHTGRRTFISILIENGISVSRVMAMTGHTNEHTLKIYVDKFSPDLHDSIEPLSF